MSCICRSCCQVDQETVPCRICGNQTPMTGTKLCDRCWELKKRIHADPAIAERILLEVFKDRTKNNESTSKQSATEV